MLLSNVAQNQKARTFEQNLKPTFKNNTAYDQQQEDTRLMTNFRIRIENQQSGPKPRIIDRSPTFNRSNISLSPRLLAVNSLTIEQVEYQPESKTKFKDSTPEYVVRL